MFRSNGQNRVVSCHMVTWKTHVVTCRVLRVTWGMSACMMVVFLMVILITPRMFNSQQLQASTAAATAQVNHLAVNHTLVPVVPMSSRWTKPMLIAEIEKYGETVPPKWSMAEMKN